MPIEGTGFMSALTSLTIAVGIMATSYYLLPLLMEDDESKKKNRTSLTAGKPGVPGSSLSIRTQESSSGTNSLKNEQANPQPPSIRQFREEKVTLNVDLIRSSAKAECREVRSMKAKCNRDFKPDEIEEEE